VCDLLHDISCRIGAITDNNEFPVEIMDGVKEGDDPSLFIVCRDYEAVSGIGCGRHRGVLDWFRDEGMGFL
jgi:hypothetical protein